MVEIILNITAIIALIVTPYLYKSLDKNFPDGPNKSAIVFQMKMKLIKYMYGVALISIVLLLAWTLLK